MARPHVPTAARQVGEHDADHTGRHAEEGPEQHVQHTPRAVTPTYDVVVVTWVVETREGGSFLLQLGFELGHVPTVHVGGGRTLRAERALKNKETQSAVDLYYSFSPFSYLAQRLLYFSFSSRQCK